MNIPGKAILGKVERTVNSVRVPLTRERLGFASLFKRTLEQMNKDQLSAFAGSLTYSIVFAIFPFLAFLTSMLGLFGERDFVNDILQQVRPALPETGFLFLKERVTALVTSKENVKFGWGALISILLSLYGVSGAFRAIMNAMNVMYDVEEKRPIWRRYLISIGIALGAILLLVTAAVLVIFGPVIGGAIAGYVGLSQVFEIAWNLLRWPILIFFALLAFALVYYFAPDVEQTFKFLTPGSFIALLLWLVFTGIFSFYVRTASFDDYGAVAGIIVLMLYIYWSSFILLLGAEMNQIIEAHVPEGKDPGEKALDKSQVSQATA